MKSEAQVAVAGPLRTAVWNWIEFHRDEFNESLHHRRLEGTPERVFDILFQIDTTNKAAIWPALAILMCISSDRIRAEYNVNSLGIPKGSRRKERGFVEALARAMLSPSKSQDAAIVCMMDICRAASRVKPGEYESPLLSIAMDIAHDVRVCSLLIYRSLIATYPLCSNRSPSGEPHLEEELARTKTSENHSTNAQTISTSHLLQMRWSHSIGFYLRVTVFLSLCSLCSLRCLML